MGLSILLRSSCLVDLSVSCQGSCWHCVLLGQYPCWPVVLWLCGWSKLGCFSFPESGPGLKVMDCSVQSVPSVFDLLQCGVCNPTGAAPSLLGVWELCRKCRALCAPALSLEHSHAKRFGRGAVSGRTPHFAMASTKWVGAEPRTLNDVLSWRKFKLHKQLGKERTSCLCSRRASWLLCQLTSALFSLSSPMWSGHIGSPMGSRAHWPPRRQAKRPAGSQRLGMSCPVFHGHQMMFERGNVALEMPALSISCWFRQVSTLRVGTWMCRLSRLGWKISQGWLQEMQLQPPKRARGKVVSGGQPHRLSCLSTLVEGQGWELCFSCQGSQGSSCSVSGSRKFIGSGGELKHKGIQRVLRHAHLWIVHFKPELLLGKSLLAQTTADFTG